MECPPAAKANGGCKKGTDVPLLPVSSSEVFQGKVTALQDSIATGNLDDTAKVLEFVIKIFRMRHPKELSELLDNLDAVQRAKDGAEDGSTDPNPVGNEEKFEALRTAVNAHDLKAMHKIAVAGISLISMLHIDQLPMLMPIYMALQTYPLPPGDFSVKFAGLASKMKDEDLIKTVAIWAVSCFAKFHPDVVVMMGLVTAD